MSTEQPAQLGYATRLPNSSRAVPWTLAIFSWLLLFVVWPVMFLVDHSPTLANSLRGVFLVVSTSIAGALGSIVCGVLGRRYAINSGAKVARWVALVGSLFGIGLFIGQCVGVIGSLWMDRHH